MGPHRMPKPGPAKACAREPGVFARFQASHPSSGNASTEVGRTNTPVPISSFSEKGVWSRDWGLGQEDGRSLLISVAFHGLDCSRTPGLESCNGHVRDRVETPKWEQGKRAQTHFTINLPPKWQKEKCTARDPPWQEERVSCKGRGGEGRGRGGREGKKSWHCYTRAWETP